MIAKKAFLSFSFFLIVWYANAQLEVSLKGGVNLSKWSAQEIDSIETSIGFHIGLGTIIRMGNSFAFEPEVLFSRQGTKIEEVKIAASYLRFPLMFQFRSTSGFYAETGPDIGFFITAKAKTENASGNVTLSSPELAWGIGLGYQTASGFGVGIRYSLGVSDVTKEDETSVKNNVLGFRLFYTFISNPPSDQ